jgi:hypothetical protein
MKNIDWKRKLTSRKLWVTVGNFITQLLVAFGVADDVILKVVSLIMAGGGVIVYILTEGSVDKAYQEAQKVIAQAELSKTELERLLLAGDADVED